MQVQETFLHITFTRTVQLPKNHAVIRLKNVLTRAKNRVPI